jgi:halocyanin-like protein
MGTKDTYTRRGLLKTGSGAAVALAAAGATGSAAAQADAYGGYLEDEGTWGGTTVDATGVEEPRIDVGAPGNGGNLAFGPAAVLVEPDTTVVWEWTGEGGQHNVVSEEGDFESQLSQEEGFTFEQTFSEGGVHQYYCAPHRALGMKGVVVVGEDNVETDLVSLGSEEDGLRASAIWAGAAVFGTVSLLGVAAYRELFDEDDLAG